MTGFSWTHFLVVAAWAIVILASAWVLKESPYALAILLIQGGGSTVSVAALCCARRPSKEQVAQSGRQTKSEV